MSFLLAFALSVTQTCKKTLLLLHKCTLCTPCCEERSLYQVFGLEVVRELICCPRKKAQSFLFSLQSFLELKNNFISFGWWERVRYFIREFLLAKKKWMSPLGISMQRESRIFPTKGKRFDPFCLVVSPSLLTHNAKHHVIPVSALN